MSPESALRLIAELADTKPAGKDWFERCLDISIVAHTALAEAVPGYAIPEKVAGSIAWRRRFGGAAVADMVLADHQPGDTAPRIGYRTVFP